MRWTLFHDAFDGDFDELSETALSCWHTRNCSKCPALRRPRIDTLKGSQLAKMKSFGSMRTTACSAWRLRIDPSGGRGACQPPACETSPSARGGREREECVGVDSRREVESTTRAATKFTEALRVVKTDSRLRERLGEKGRRYIRQLYRGEAALGRFERLVAKAKRL